MLQRPRARIYSDLLDRFFKELVLLGTMRVSWLSGRVLGKDLCGTTQSSLADGLVGLGHEVFVYSPGHSYSEKFQHIPLQKGKIKGLLWWGNIQSLRTHLGAINASDHVLVDWRLHSITPLITTNWTLIDRGPPADRGMLSIFQWKQWSRGWKKANSGTAVSEKHADFIHLRTGMPLNRITVLQAGADMAKFTPGLKGGPLKIAYQGRIDFHRGVLLLPQILNGLQKRGVEASLHIHGEGDAVHTIKQMDVDNLHLTSALDSNKLAACQSAYDVGILPMPKSKVWELASPLKRSEYLASGMIICGIDHMGHQLPKSGEWLQLYPEEKFVEMCCEWLAGLNRQDLQPLQKSARTYAETHLNWDYTARILADSISE